MVQCAQLALKLTCRDGTDDITNDINGQRRGVQSKVHSLYDGHARWEKQLGSQTLGRELGLQLVWELCNAGIRCTQRGLRNAVARCKLATR